MRDIDSALHHRCVGFLISNAHLLESERLSGRQNIIGRRKLVLLRVSHQQCVVLFVIVRVVDQDVEHHPTEQLAHVSDIQIAIDHASAPQELRQLGISKAFRGGLKCDASPTNSVCAGRRHDRSA